MPRGMLRGLEHQMAIRLLLVLTLFGCSGGAAEAGPAADPTDDATSSEPDDHDAVELVGQLHGPLAIAEVCGYCGTGFELVVDGERHDFTAVGQVREAAAGCMDAGREIRVVGRFLEGPGSCGEGRCRYFAAERIETDCRAGGD